MKKDKIKSTLIITTYNWPDALELVLESVKNQVMLPTEVIIADDGSTNETKQLIESFQSNFPVPLKHIWHEDKGFRRSAILNLAISKTDSDYIIQLDGDCIIHKNFVGDHLKSIEKDTYLFGSRVNIQEPFLNDFFKNKIITFSYLAKGIKKRNRNIHFPALGEILYKRNNKLSRKLRGCNLSYWKTDFLKVNGYNEDMIGWGREDSEFVIRMINNGTLGKRLKYKAIIYHIWHKESSKEKLNINNIIQESALKNKLSWCDNGIDKYLIKAQENIRFKESEVFS
ncbi:glycosyltransferase family 2 protein [Flavivirga spongiicola]|uniref:Glycosyltransferase family 2 protein n=1 Tax=Flavivirga spongiicola TaxID=421621 RepID=A0ABU7XQ18_9FLAO|nr:glycosyltransferase family 2 protein [Flavivirga sp. MEBiC05379]MDO5977538.1 glycosyltransferase family 2 protein [Flavivirga sp. MEBiC05379]